MRTGSVWALGWVLGCGIAVSAAAQEPPDTGPVADPTAAPKKADEEIVVYGTRVRATLAETQASVGFVTDEQIVDMDIQNLRDSFRLFANVIDADWVDAGFVLRGVNSEGLTPGGSPLASVYVDGAAQTVQGSRRGLRGLWDARQVEIYRGPQSTLSGRASLAGAIYLMTNDPSFENQYAGRVTLGEDETFEGAVMMSGPLLDDVLAFRITAEYQRRESDLNYPGYAQYSDFDEFKEDEFYQVRGKLLYQPESLNGGRALLTYAFGHDSPVYDDIAGPGLGFAYDERRGDLNAGTPFFQENRSTDNHSLSLDVSVPVSELLAFTSTSTVAYTDLDRPSINAGTPGEVFIALGHEKQTYLTQELRLNYDDADRFRWVAGLYAAYEKSWTVRTLSNFFSGGRNDTSRPTSHAYNGALFGEATYEFVPSWEATLGGRLDYEKQRQSFFFSRDFTNPALTDILTTGRSEGDDFTFLPKVALAKHLTPEHSLAFTVQKGFRAGGAGIDGSDGSPYDFDAESTWNYELSYRGSLLDDRMTIAANAFYTDWEDQQVEIQQIPGDFTSTIVLNAGTSHLYGGELELQVRPMEPLSAFLAVGYVKTEFDDFASSAGDFSGLPFPQAPKWTVALGGDYEHTSGFFVGADAKHVSEYLARDLQNAPIDEVGDYIVTNVRAGYRAERWSVTIFADNVFDEDYFLYRDVIGTFDCCATLGPGRVAGVTLRADY